MPSQINSNYSPNFQKFVDFANNAYATKGEDTVARFTGMPSGDYKGSFASFRRTSEMKSANDQVRDLFRKTVADMFRGEKNIPDIVRDAMKMEDFGKGKPLTARRIMAVKSAIDIVGGGMFERPASVAKATSAGYLPHEMVKLARVATLYRNATGCSEAEAEEAALDPSSKARRLYDYGGRFVKNADSFKAGLELMDKFSSWYGNLVDDCAANKRDTLTKLNLNASVCTRDAETAVQKFVFEEMAVNDKIPLNAAKPEDMFGMAKNPAMRFVGRGYTTSFANSLAQIPPEKRSLLYAVFDALDKLPANAGELAKRERVDYAILVASRVMKNFDAVAALQASKKLDRAHLVPLLYPDLDVTAGSSNRQIKTAYETRIAQDLNIMASLHMLAENSGATLDEVTAAISSGTRLENAPGISSFSGKLEELDGTARGGRQTMIYDLVRPTTPNLAENGQDALADENVKFVFNFPDGEKLDTITGSLDKEDVQSRCNTIADKIADLCGKIHPKQLSSVYFALSQSAIGPNVNGGFLSAGIVTDEHMPVTFTLSRNDETGAVTIKYSEPKDFPVKFNWTTTIDVNGNSTITPMRIDSGKYEAKALSHANAIADYLPGKELATAEALIKDMLAYCGDDYDLKELVSQNITGICVTGTAKLREPNECKARIDAIRANLEEVRQASAGNAMVEKVGRDFLAGMSGKSVHPGLIGKIIKAASAETPGEFANLTASSTPQQLLKGISDMRASVESAIRNANVRDYLEGGDEMTPTREFVTSLLLTKLPASQLKDVHAALRSETTSKLISVLDDFMQGIHPAGAVAVSFDVNSWIDTESSSLEEAAINYNRSVETLLGKNEGPIKEFPASFDKNAFGAKDIFNKIVPFAENDVKIHAENERQNENIRTGVQVAKPKAINAYSKAGEGNATKVDKLIHIALSHCAANADAVNVVANNIDTILVSNTATLRSIDQVRERAKAVAANFDELKELSKNNPAIYEAGKRMLTAMSGKALPPGMVGKLISTTANVKLDAIRKLSARSSGFDIHCAVKQLRDNIVQVMNQSGAEATTGGPDEKQACRNFIAAVMMNRCGANALRAMQGVFASDTPAKLLTLYMSIGNGEFNEGLETQTAFRLEDHAGSHSTQLLALKDAIDLAVNNRLGTSLAPIYGLLNADEIDGGDILDDLLKQAESQSVVDIR